MENIKDDQLKAIIDIGSLRVKLTVFNTQTLDVISNKSYLTLLGKNMSEDGVFNEESLSKLDEALGSIKEEFASLNCFDVKLIGTESLRIAKNTEEVYQIVEKHFPGHDVTILDQDIEGEMFFKAVSRCFNNQEIAVMDIGGGSVQILNGAQHSILNKHLYKTGTYALWQKYSPVPSSVNTGYSKALDEIKEVFNSLSIRSDVLIFGSTCMQDFLNESGISLYNDRPIRKHPLYTTVEDLKDLLSKILQFAPDDRGHFYPSGDSFVYGADYLLMNVIETAERMGAKYIYPTNMNSSYGFVD